MNGTPRRSATRSSTSVMPTPASPDVQRYRGAVIGAGGTARQSHLPALRTAAGVRARIDIVAVVDSAVDVPPVDGIPLLSHPEQLARVGPLDFIDICTPTASHLDLTLWGLERGYHVVCEKPDRKSTRLNSSHLVISYAVFCLKKKKKYTKNELNRHQ